MKSHTTKMKVCESIGDFENVRHLGYITNMYFLSNGNLCVHYEPVNPDSCVTSPSYLGSLVLGYSRRLMDVYLDRIDAYTNPETTFIRTDTDSIIVRQQEEEKLKKYLLPEMMKNAVDKTFSSLKPSFPTTATEWSIEFSNDRSTRVEDDAEGPFSHSIVLINSSRTASGL